MSCSCAGRGGERRTWARVTAWRSLRRRFEPRVKTRFARVLLGSVNFDFSGGLLARIEQTLCVTTADARDT